MRIAQSLLLFAAADFEFLDPFCGFSLRHNKYFQQSIKYLELATA